MKGKVIMGVYTLEDLAAKIDWEGGFEMALEYGITYDEVPDEVSEQWKKAQELHTQLNKLWEDISNILPDPEF